MPALFGQAPKDRVYITRTDDAGATTVQFGDGGTGARLASGQDNVRASYRKGIGLEGLIDAGQLSLLLGRPLGVKSVVNPLPAVGAADPESRDDARANAPITVLTLGRTVSLRDYEDFARGFAGVAKALATWSWNGRSRRVFVTVAGPNGAAIPPDSDLRSRLLKALSEAGDPFVPVEIASFASATFRIQLKVKVQHEFREAAVLGGVEAALRTAFGFDARAFGQPVFLSEVVETIHEVPGVVAIDVDQLHRTTPPDQQVEPHPRLLAALPQLRPDGSMSPAEILTLDPAPLDGLEIMP